MVIYSHSRLSSFEQCPLKFKYRYLDKIIPEVEKTIEAHLGSAVHDTLEWLYHQVKGGKIPTIDDLIMSYTGFWEKEFSEDIKIVRNNLTAGDYFNKGVKFLIDYYIKNNPFDDGTIELEKRILVNLDSESKYRMQGFVDRLVFNKQTGEYEIHDYKTANSLPKREKIETDKQLALYSIGIKDYFNTNANVTLVWHYLAHNIKIVSKRTNEQLEELKQKTIELIKKIETTTDFPPCKSALCGWCEYKSMCPAWGGKPREKQDSLLNITNKKIENELNKPDGLKIIE